MRSWKIINVDSNSKMCMIDLKSVLLLSGNLKTLKSAQKRIVRNSKYLIHSHVKII